MAEVELEVTDGVAVLTLAAPDRRNALTVSMAEELISACERIDRDPTIGAAVVQGTGGSFCSGAHRELLASAGADPAEAGNYQSLNTIYESFHRVGQLLVPSIAAIRGAAVGAGVNLALATDLRVVAEGARFIAGFLRIGLHPGGGHFSIAARAMGRQATAAMSLFNEEISGSRAQELGLAWAAVPDEEVEGLALSMAKTLSGDPDLARAALKTFRLETSAAPLSWDSAIEIEHAAQLWSLRRRAPSAS